MTVKVHLEIKGAVVSAEGDQAFVEVTIERWKHLLEWEMECTGPVATQPRELANVPNPGADPSWQYDSVFAMHNDRIKIIATIPGSSKAEQTRNVALLLLYGEHLRGADEVTAESIKDACVDQGCYDNKNFASHLKSLKPKVVMDPKPGGDYTVKLTAPGRKSVKEMVERLNNQ